MFKLPYNYGRRRNFSYFGIFTSQTHTKKEKKISSSQRRCSVKKVFLKISQNSKENTCARVSFLLKLQTSGLQIYQRRDSGTAVFL